MTRRTAKAIASTECHSRRPIVFLDENAIRFFDPDYSDEEDRFLMLGISVKLRVLVVCHGFRVDDSTVRIISARKANKKEAATYRDYWE